MTPISTAAEELTVDAEISSRAAYDRVYHKPEWPGGASGVTWGIGYDAGQTDAATITADWGDLVSSSMLAAMTSCAGIKGFQAHAMLSSVRDRIDIPWQAAMDVFEKRDVPKYLAQASKHLPNFDLLQPDCKGAIFSLVYNRGTPFEAPGDRYTEMRNIKAHMAAKEFDKIPDELRGMKRLWPTMRGLQKRRDDEATLFAHGLRGLVVDARTPIPAAPAQLPATDEDFWSHIMHRGISYLEKLQ